MRATARCACLALALVAGCDSPKTALQAEDVDRAVKSAASLAAEGALLVDQAQQGRVDANYVWVHQQALQQESDKAAESLHKPVPPGLRERQQQVAALHARLAATLGQVGPALDAPVELRSLGRSLDSVAGQARALKDKQ